MCLKFEVSKGTNQLERNMVVTAESWNSQGLNKRCQYDNVAAQYRVLNGLKTLEDCLFELLTGVLLLKKQK